MRSTVLGTGADVVMTKAINDRLKIEIFQRDNESFIRVRLIMV